MVMTSRKTNSAPNPVKIPTRVDGNGNRIASTGFRPMCPGLNWVVDVYPFQMPFLKMKNNTGDETRHPDLTEIQIPEGHRRNGRTACLTGLFVNY